MDKKLAIVQLRCNEGHEPRLVWPDLPEKDLRAAFSHESLPPELRTEPPCPCAGKERGMACGADLTLVGIVARAEPRLDASGWRMVLVRADEELPLCSHNHASEDDAFTCSEANLRVRVIG